jgi:membrane protease YdiL (CAAX protease family)
LLLSVGGIQTGGLPAPQNPTSAANFFASVIYAPITEEFSLRILPIGFFVALRALVQVLDSPRITGENSIWSIVKIAVKSVILGFFSPEKAKALVGLRRVATHGFRGIQWWEWTLLFVTSIIFGLLHVLLGPWDTGKAVTASLSGFGLGLAYIVYGAYADILVHWFFNFYTLVFSLNVVLGIDVYSGGLLDFALAMDILIVLLQIFLGIVGIIVGIIWWQDKRSKGQQRTYTQGYIPSFT